jgi:hypothetical protein
MQHYAFSAQRYIYIHEKLGNRFLGNVGSFLQTERKPVPDKNIFIFTSMKNKYLAQKWNDFDFHDNCFMVYCHIRQGTQKEREKGSCLGPHMNIYDFHRCLLPSRNPVGNSCNLQDMWPNNYVFWNNSEDSAFHKPGIATTDKIHWTAIRAKLHSTDV